MDEPKDKAQNSNQTAPKGDSGVASGDKPGTPEDEPTLTQAQADEIADKKVGDALRVAGRDAKALEKQRTALEAWQKQKDEAELERYKDDPDKLDVIKERQALAKERAEHEAEIKAANDAKLEIACFRLGGQYGVKPEDLKEAAVEFGLKSGEQIESLAKRMAKGEPSGETPPATPPLKPMSSKTMGGERSFKQLEQDYVDGQISTAEYQQAMKDYGKT